MESIIHLVLEQKSSRELLVGEGIRGLSALLLTSKSAYRAITQSRSCVVVSLASCQRSGQHQDLHRALLRCAPNASTVVLQLTVQSLALDPGLGCVTDALLARVSRLVVVWGEVDILDPRQDGEALIALAAAVSSRMHAADGCVQLVDIWRKPWRYHLTFQGGVVTEVTCTQACACQVSEWLQRVRSRTPFAARLQHATVHLEGPACAGKQGAEAHAQQFQQPVEVLELQDAGLETAWSAAPPPCCRALWSVLPGARRVVVNHYKGPPCRVSPWAVRAAWPQLRKLCCWQGVGLLMQPAKCPEDLEVWRGDLERGLLERLNVAWLRERAPDTRAVHLLNVPLWKVERSPSE